MFPSKKADYDMISIEFQGKWRMIAAFMQVIIGTFFSDLCHVIY